MKLSNPAALDAALRGDFRNAEIASTPGGIEAQEAQGQRDLVAQQLIPIQGANEAANKLGIVLGKEADDLFFYAELPKGWEIRATDHSMWSDLIDADGKKRAAIFYKAAFYDRKAFIRIENEQID